MTTGIIPNGFAVQWGEFRNFSWTSIAFLAAIILLGALCLLHALFAWQSQDYTRFAAYSLISMAASVLKIRLPSLRGTMSVNFFAFLVAIVELTGSEMVVMGAASALAQYLWRSKTRPTVVRMLFNVAAIAVAVHVAHQAYSLALRSGQVLPVQLAAAACTYFVMNTLPVAVVIRLTEGPPLLQTWRNTYFWAFPYYLVGAAIAGGFSASNRLFGWQTSVLILPVVYTAYRSYYLYLTKLETERLHAEAERTYAEQMAALHVRSIEALALAIEAKDQNTHDHLRRVQVYCVEMAKELGLPEPERHAILAASMLHDIGKLAVPEHIISKPGKLTPEEFEKMKIHPVIGAEIIDRVRFPYPVSPIVRHHHEKWDGSGYPDGLKGEEIPIGARILAAVDCLDALASDRQYRRAVPLEEAMEMVKCQSGVSYEPRIVDLLCKNYRAWEAKARTASADPGKLSTDVRIERGSAPAAGFEAYRGAGLSGGKAEFLTTIAAARQEAQLLFEMTHDMLSSLGLNETLSVVAVRLKKLIPFDTFAVYLAKDNHMVSEFAVGDEHRLFSSLRVPFGHGLSGWVAENLKPIVNGNPSVEIAYSGDTARETTLSAALAVPLEASGGLVGTLALYSTERDGFSGDHLRILQALSYKLAHSIENGLKFRRAEDNSTTDYLTGLPNARSLFLRLQEEVERSRHAGPLAVLVCDVDGFKQVNDRFGHLEGNRCLQAIASRLKEICRQQDYLARMGGDEFVLLLPGAAAETLPGIVSRLVAATEQASRFVCGQDIVSLSVGTAWVPDDGFELEPLLAKADRQMYLNKQTRRGRVRDSSARFVISGAESETELVQ